VSLMRTPAEMVIKKRKGAEIKVKGNGSVQGDLKREAILRKKEVGTTE